MSRLLFGGTPGARATDKPTKKLSFDPSTVEAPPAPAPQPSRTQRYRGVSFRKEYTQNNPLRFANASGGRKRAPSMIHAPTKHMLPPRRKEDSNKITVVLDLDETLIYAREGPLYARPGIEAFLDFIGQYCEVVVWTAGVRAYAQAVIRNIDPKGVIAHCIYRHEKWFTGQPGYSKDLSLVGRNLDEMVIIENTPDCIRGYEENGILVADYEGGEDEDHTLFAIQQVLEELVKSGKKVPEGIRGCKLLTRSYVPTDLGDQLYVYCLDPKKADEIRFNRDLAKNQPPK
jgi:RNA polymerase II subunit A small phosphatase-like protein